MCADSVSKSVNRKMRPFLIYKAVVKLKSRALPRREWIVKAMCGLVKTQGFGDVVFPDA